MVTLFTSCKPFVNGPATFQTNALISWCQQKPEPTIVVYGNELGTAGLCSILKLNHISDCPVDEHGLPILSFMFSITEQFAETEFLCFANADIVILDSLDAVAVELAAYFPDGFLGVCRRWDVPLDKPIDFDDGWREWLRIRCAAKGELYTRCSSDLFLYKRPLGFDLELFTIGRPRWDNWMMWKACQVGIPVVDITDAVTVAHPWHNYGPDGVTPRKPFFKHPSSKRNEDLAAEGGAFCQKHARKAGNLWKISNTQVGRYEVSQLK